MIRGCVCREGDESSHAEGKLDVSRLRKCGRRTWKKVESS